MRARLELAIEAMIALLDELDGDSDAEPEPLEEQHDCELADFVALPSRSPA
jgi:hypothetical protein